MEKNNEKETLLKIILLGEAGSMEFYAVDKLYPNSLATR